MDFSQSGDTLTVSSIDPCPLNAGWQTYGGVWISGLTSFAQDITPVADFGHWAIQLSMVALPPGEYVAQVWCANALGEGDPDGSNENKIYSPPGTANINFAVTIH